VGYGPAGAVAAGLLASQGLRVFVCDKAHDVYEMPRAFALDHEIMRVFQQLGVADAVMQHAEPFTPSEFYGVDGQLIKRFGTAAPPYPLAHPPALVFTQPPVERLLRAKVQGMPGVEVALGSELVSFTQDEHGVALQLRLHGSGTGLREVRARTLLACDGASSTVRRLLGVELEDLGFDQAWLVVDVLVHPQAISQLPPTSVQYCEPSRPSTYLIGPKNHRRWEISINPGEDPREVATAAGTWKLLSRWLRPDQGELWRQASYRFHALVAARWRVGQVFLAGDAAHQQPPFLGQGMCQGIRDVANLSWKLAAVLQGRAPDRLLDTYGTERKAHVAALTTRIKNIGRLVGERDLTQARLRDAELLAECGGVVKSVPRQNVQPALEAGLLSASLHDARGTLFPQPWVWQGGTRHRLDDLTGCGWRLFLTPTASAWPESLGFPGMPVVLLPTAAPEAVVANAATPMVWTECDGVVSAWWDRMGAQAAIVRPDHIVFAAVHSASALQAALAELSEPLNSFA
jgi:3-(3-hydroxy-phenyl)propionate hydroxylase